MVERVFPRFAQTAFVKSCSETHSPENEWLTGALNDYFYGING